MKPVERKQVARAIRSAVPNLYEKGRLLAATPRGRILRGLYLEPSSDAARLYVWSFVQPLYTPASMVVLDFGKRLGGPSRTWTAGDTSELATVVRDEGLPFFGPVSSPTAFASWDYLNGRADAYALEAKAYSLIASAQLSEGVQALRELAGSLPADTAWIIAMRKRALELADLAEANPAAAHELLARWQSETVSALRIHDLP